MAFKLYVPSKIQFIHMGLVGLVTLFFCASLLGVMMGDVHAYQSTKTLLLHMGSAPIPFIIILLLMRYHEIYVKPYTKYDEAC